MLISVVTTMLNEAENIPHLIRNINDGLKGLDFEVIMVDDGSTDGTIDVIRTHMDDRYKIIVLNRNYGQTPAMAAGIDQAVGDFIVTIDADLQNDPSDIPDMLSKLLKEDLDLVVGNRKNRKDGFILRKVPSRIANYLIRNLSGVFVSDYGCTLKIFRKDLAKNLNLYGEMHRFIPILASLEGARISETDVKHHHRQYGTSKYGLGRTLHVISDRMLLLFFQKYLKRPIHFFGPLGLFSLASGSMIFLYLLTVKLLGQEIWGRPILILAAIMFLGGIQLLTFGIITELIVRVYYESQRKETYRIRKVITAIKATVKTAEESR